MMTIVVIRHEGSAHMNNSRKSISTGSRIPWVDIRHSRSNWRSDFESGHGDSEPQREPGNPIEEKTGGER